MGEFTRHCSLSAHIQSKHTHREVDLNVKAGLFAFTVEHAHTMDDKREMLLQYNCNKGSRAQGNTSKFNKCSHHQDESS